MLNKKILFMAILLISLLSLSAVSAEDDAVSDVIADTNDVTVLDESIEDSSLGDSQSDENVLSDNEVRSFSDLQDEVNAPIEELNLTCDYVYNEESDSAYIHGVEIGRYKTINGNGHTIDGNNLSRIFSIPANYRVTFKDINFVNARTPGRYGDGGAIWALGNAVTAINCNFTNNHATQNGGAIVSVNATNCIFTDNHADNDGGAIYKGTANSCNFTGNHADNNGGAIYESAADSCSFTGNYAYTDGGAAYNCSLSNCNFTKNSATDGGAMIYGNATGCDFTENTAENYGGAIRGIEEPFGVIPTIKNCTFTGNTAKEGGAVYECEVYYSNFTENHAKLGGAIFGLEDMSYAVNCNFYKNSAEDYGGAIRHCDAVNCNFIENTAGIAGGAIDAGSATLSNFTKNSAGERGGATSDSNDEQCIFIQNSAGIAGGAISGLACRVENCTFIFNRAPENVDAEVLDHCDECNFIKPTLTASDLYEAYNSRTKFPFELSTSDMTFDGINTTIRILKNDTLILIDTALTGDGWTVNMPTGIYKIELSIPNSNVEPITKIITGARCPTKIIYKDMVTKTVDVDTDGRIGEYFQITLVDAENKALVGKHIQIGFNGKIYERTTDSNGQAKLQVNLKKAFTYTFAVCYLGDSNFEGYFVASKITTKSQTPKLEVPNKSYKATAKTKTLTATLKSEKGNPVKGKKITFTVNGKTYSATTNDKGVATVKVSLNKKGTYTFTVKFDGECQHGTYTAVTKKGTLKLT